jgi:hypothetical protein
MPPSGSAVKNRQTSEGLVQILVLLGRVLVIQREKAVLRVRPVTQEHAAAGRGSVSSQARPFKRPEPVGVLEGKERMAVDDGVLVPA